MLSARSLFQEIIDNDRSFALFCSIAAGGESQGGWENARIAALVPQSAHELAPKITRHGADEDKHGRIFNALMRKRGLAPVPVPLATTPLRVSTAVWAIVGSTTAWGWGVEL